LNRLMFHIPMSSPHRIRMFGFLAAIVRSPHWTIWSDRDD
jgi:hypothetical protein